MDFIKSSATFFCLATETLTEISDSYINEKQPLLTQLNILQQFERAWPFANNKSSSCWSAPQGTVTVHAVGVFR